MIGIWKSAQPWDQGYHFVHTSETLCWCYPNYKHQKKSQKKQRELHTCPSSFEVLQLNNLENSSELGFSELNSVDEICSSCWLWHLAHEKAEKHCLVFSAVILHPCVVTSCKGIREQKGVNRNFAIQKAESSTVGMCKDL